jgi:hypothetical protein
MDARRHAQHAAALDIASIVLFGWGHEITPFSSGPLAVTTILYHGVSFAMLGCSPAAWTTYASAPAVAPAGSVPFFRRLVATRKDQA